MFLAEILYNIKEKKNIKAVMKVTLSYATYVASLHNFWEGWFIFVFVI